MEEESFEDLEVAETVNRYFVAVKVDREERPDVDSIYLKAVQAMGGRGGWPLNVFLNPDLTPFFGGTYFPARDGDRGRGIGFLTLIDKIRQAHDEKNGDLLKAGESITAYIRNMSEGNPSAAPLEKKNFTDIFNHTASVYDPVNGGIKGAPKFPSSLPVSLMLRLHRRTGNKDALNMALTTLKKMFYGGMYDHVGGGFHRYSVDSRWLVPHFEKMLYGNARLAADYVSAWQLTRDAFYREAAIQILDYVTTDMTSIDGGFFSATDADSLNDNLETEEGFFFTWTPEEIDRILDPDDAAVFRRFYGVTPEGNFEGRNTLHIRKPLADFAETNEIDADQLRHCLNRSKKALKAVRSRRHPPLRDEKIIAS